MAVPQVLAGAFKNSDYDQLCSFRWSEQVAAIAFAHALAMTHNARAGTFSKADNAHFKTPTHRCRPARPILLFSDVAGMGKWKLSV